MNQDVIIIGGGLGGLFTGALLAHEGLVVKVLEKNATIGGGLQTFMRRGIEFETGMHILGGFRERGTLQRICSYLGIMESLHLRDTDDDCMDEITYGEDGATYHIASGRNGFAESLAVYFPHERTNLQAYVDELYRLTEEVDAFYLRPGRETMVQHSEHFLWPADRLIAHYVSDPKLRELLAYMNPMYGGVAGHTPAYIHALINVLYIEGTTRFEGGSRQLADALQFVIEEAGGKVVPRAEVAQVEVAERKVRRVVTQDGTSYTADRYIAAVHPCELLRVIDAPAFPKSYRDRLEAIPNTYSAFTLFIELEERAFPYINHTCYFQQTYHHVWQLADYGEDWPRGFMYMTPPEVGQGAWASRLIIHSPIPYDAVRPWAHTHTGCRGEAYEAWKVALCDRILDSMEMLYPDFRRTVKHVYTATPLTIRDYYHTKNGALYGYAKDCDNILLSQIPVFTKVHNLYLTGQCVGLHGICGVPLSAILTAEAIVGANQIMKKL